MQDNPYITGNVSYTEGANDVWNYSHPDQEGFSTQLSGQIVELDRIWQRDFSSKQPKVFPDGNPIMQYKLTVLTANGEEKAWYMSGSKASGSYQAVLSALRILFKTTTWHAPAGNMAAQCVGRMVTISTKQPPEGFGYGPQNPRPWNVALGEFGSPDVMHKPSVKDSGGEEFAKSKREGQAPVPQQQQPPVAGVPVPQTMAQPQYQPTGVPTYAAPAPAQVPPAMQAQVAQAMQASPGYQQMQQVVAGVPGAQAPAQQQYNPADLYDEDMPF